MYDSIRKYNKLAEEGKALENLEHFVQSINSYLGMMIHFESYNIRKKVMYMLHSEWWKYIMMDGKFSKLIIKKRYKSREQLKARIRSGEYKRLLTPELETEEPTGTGQ